VEARVRAGTPEATLIFMEPDVFRPPTVPRDEE